ncbi:Hypothetical predicted protein, partial [Xyrichtys novacula]
RLSQIGGSAALMLMKMYGWLSPGIHLLRQHYLSQAMTLKQLFSPSVCGCILITVTENRPAAHTF